MGTGRHQNVIPRSLRFQFFGPVDEHDWYILLVNGVFKLTFAADQVLAGVFQNYFFFALGTSEYLEQFRLNHKKLLIAGGTGAGW